MKAFRLHMERHDTVRMILIQELNWLTYTVYFVHLCEIIQTEGFVDK